jgi:hypothetical protein
MPDLPLVAIQGVGDDELVAVWGHRLLLATQGSV